MGLVAEKNYCVKSANPQFFQEKGIGLVAVRAQINIDLELNIKLAHLAIK